ncbi:MAG TPA: cobalamin-independent methionine synthase II family protein [Candidatus Dormibacteraeota bacterium]|nr:cobalamin-independent methionine synthase II family protein [Candidatus Dormibacteraeota bacterium]
MKQSTERILTTHVGSLARPKELLETMREKENGRPYDRALFDEQVRTAVRDVVRKQAEVGLDVVADGEMGKVNFITYVAERLSGFETEAGRSSRSPSWQRELQMFPEYYEEYFKKYAATAGPLHVMVCRGPIKYIGHDAVAHDIANLKAAMEGLDVVEAFMPATSPRGFGGNEHYASEDEYQCAVADALREEYQAIVDAGLVLQVDDPGLTEILSVDPATTPEQRLKVAERHVEIVNHALRGIPEDRVRYHTCYGLNHGPRLHDVPLADVVPLMLKVNASAYSFEVANPRHQHEWRIWETTKLPEGKALIPGFLSHAMNFVEHPRLIADGIVQYANLVGRERVIAGADCGFSSRASFAPEVDPRVVWAKFEALVEGARLATRELW